MNPQDEIIAAACNALDKAHALLTRVVTYHDNLPPLLLDDIGAWIAGEYDPGERKPNG